MFLLLIKVISVKGVIFVAFGTHSSVVSNNAGPNNKRAPQLSLYKEQVLSLKLNL